MAERQQALADGDPEGPGRRQPVLLHRRRRHQHHAQQRPLPDQPQAARRAQRRRRATIIRRLQREVAARRRHLALHAAGAGPDHRRRRSAAPSTSSCSRTPIRTSSPSWVPKLVDKLSRAAAIRRCRERHLSSNGLSAYIDDRPRHRRPLRHHAGDDRQRALRRLRPAHRLDDLHPVQPVPRHPRGRSDAAALARFARLDLSAVLDRHRPGAAVGDRHGARADGAAADRPSRPVSRRPRSRSISRPARRWARRSTRSSRRSDDIGLPRQRHHQLPGRGARLPGLARATSCC